MRPNPSLSIKQYLKDNAQIFKMSNWKREMAKSGIHDDIPQSSKAHAKNKEQLKEPASIFNAYKGKSVKPLQR